MTLTVEDGTGLPDADAYISVSYADSYLHARGHTSWAQLLTGQKEAAIRNATRYADDRWKWKGLRATDDQALDWPREGARDERGNEYEGVPSELEEAVAEYALRDSLSPLDPDPTYDPSGRSVTEKDERIEGAVMERTKFDWGNRTVKRKYPVPDKLLAPLRVVGNYVMRV